MCTKNMVMGIRDSNQLKQKLISILPTHYKCSEDGHKKKVENSKMWKLNVKIKQIGGQSEV